ncbi:DICT sensory domain-containing protein [Haloplanus sp. C73]|uniref:DICT sensory domain-containing protein n=1 Tax=Haloplanus sp. C73 TaxID=3421641 RepID=UPI003EBA6C2F
MGVDASPSSIREFFEEVDESDVSLVTVNRQQPEQIQTLLADAFETQSVELTERSVPDRGENLLALRKDGRLNAVSPLTEVMRSFLLVNSDRFRTRTGFDHEIPTVLRGLDETLFDLRGYPQSNKEKLLLILLSRHIERRAYEAGEGRLRSTFQRLSRLEDEHGTRTVYERIAERPVDVHVYGVPDRVPDRLDVTVHGGTSDEYRNAWCVVFRSPGESGAALLAYQYEPNHWRGFWTYDAETVARVDSYIERAL